MNTAEYERLNQFERTYWWHVGRKYIIDGQLKRHIPTGKKLKILNIGCGTGDTIGLLEKYGEVKNIDVSKEAVRIAKKNGHKKVYLYDGKKIPFPKGSFDLILALDVLEHIKDDSEALTLWKKYLTSNGLLIITVPAYQWLWSGHDEALKHYRRYSAANLHRVLNLSGFKVIKRTYAIVFSFPIIVLYRLFKSFFKDTEEGTSYVMVPKPVNSFFIWLLKVEGWILKYLSSPYGTSVLFVAKN